MVQGKAGRCSAYLDVQRWLCGAKDMPHAARQSQVINVVWSRVRIGRNKNCILKSLKSSNYKLNRWNRAKWRVRTGTKLPAVDFVRTPKENNLSEEREKAGKTVRLFDADPCNVMTWPDNTGHHVEISLTWVEMVEQCWTQISDSTASLMRQRLDGSNHQPCEHWLHWLVLVLLLKWLWPHLCANTTPEMQRRCSECRDNIAYYLYFKHFKVYSHLQDIEHCLLLQNLRQDSLV